MKKKLIAIVLVIVALFAMYSTTFAAGSYRVRGYYRSNGTYVQPYYRTYPNSYYYDNYSSYGNYNPYTGKYGTRYYYGR